MQSAMFLSPQMEAATYRALVKRNLWKMQETFQETGGLDMDAYHAIEQSVANLHRLVDSNAKPETFSPNPCAEILLRSTRPDND